MNSNETSQTESAVRGCGLTSQGTVDHTSSEVYGWLVFITVISIITCPITAVLNVLIMIAVKTKNQLRTKSNIALACLSSTDAVMGVIGQPLFIGWLIEELQGNTSGTYCVLIGFARRDVLRVLGIASLFHLAMVNVERYIAIKHSLRYEIIVTEARLIGVSALLWTITLLSKLFTSNNFVNFDIQFGLTSLCMVTIFVCQVVLCFKTRRHEKEIASQQVSVEAREKFLKEKKALKLTTTVIFCVIICYLPIIISRSLISTIAINSVNSVYFVHFSGAFAVIANSLLNPLIHCVRMKEFRLALKELLIFRKGN